jgi:hypothetical protein
MHDRTFHRLAWALALVAAGSMTNAAWGQEGSEPQSPNHPAYATPADLSRTPPTTPNQFVSESVANDDSNLAARVAELEKALKKADDKAKEDKKTAASKMTCTPGGRIHIDTAAFSQDQIDKGRYNNEQNGVEFRTARLALYGGGFDVIKYQIEYDMATKDRPRCKDTYFAVTDLPVLQNIQIGHFKEPYSLDELQATTTSRSWSGTSPTR